MKKLRVFRCKHCGHVSQASFDITKPHAGEDEDRCPDPKAPGGYWYCDWEELVPKRTKKKVVRED